MIKSLFLVFKDFKSESVRINALISKLVARSQQTEAVCTERIVMSVNRYANTVPQYQTPKVKRHIEFDVSPPPMIFLASEFAIRASFCLVDLYWCMGARRHSNLVGQQPIQQLDRAERKVFRFLDIIQVGVFRDRLAVLHPASVLFCS